MPATKQCPSVLVYRVPDGQQTSERMDMSALTMKLPTGPVVRRLWVHRSTADRVPHAVLRENVSAESPKVVGTEAAAYKVL